MRRKPYKQYSREFKLRSHSPGRCERQDRKPSRARARSANEPDLEVEAATGA